MIDWARVRDAVYCKLKAHVDVCLLCRRGVEPTGGVLVHCDCEHGVVLLSEWFLAKGYREVPPADDGDRREAFSRQLRSGL